MSSIRDMKKHIYEKLQEKEFANVSEGTIQIQGDIFNYIEAKQIQCTKNKNGIFFNLSTMKDEHIKDIYTMICYHKDTYDNCYIVPKDTQKIDTPIKEQTYNVYSLNKFQERIVNLIKDT